MTPESSQKENFTSKKEVENLKKFTKNSDDIAKCDNKLTVINGTSESTPTPLLHGSQGVTNSQDKEKKAIMWVDKYKPVSLKNVIGQHGDQSNAKKLVRWLENWFENQSGKKKLVKPSK